LALLFFSIEERMPSSFPPVVFFLLAYRGELPDFPKLFSFPFFYSLLCAGGKAPSIRHSVFLEWLFFQCRACGDLMYRFFVFFVS